ncbi:M56 family metallopeptidase [Lacipirellula parvula]|uniref:Uncharacterized protein n=1 Tax=Lacipirellula parvula TaxID=2650471 RepID=A0A5K7XAK3_9BACT|nr:M56 family metallopeptidase [Lacipirellula parvula]BBO32977.1 hypothetical protein PLANPX_2589 [Lacipirellula parvula]
MAAIFSTLFWCALQVSLFLLLATPVYLLVRRRNPSAGTAVAASALTAVVVLSALAISPWPRWSLEWPTATNAAAEQVAAVKGGGEANVNAAAIDDESPTPVLSGAASANDDSLLAVFWRVAQYSGDPAATSAGSAALADERVAWPNWIVWAIAAGVVLGAAHLLISLAAVRRLIDRSAPLDDPATQQELDDLRRQLDVTRPISLHVSAEISTPATVGMLRPAIILPTSWGTWTSVERRAVLAHELAHIAGRDFAAWLVARGAVVLHFYHPLVRWFVGRLQLDQELAADDTAARLLGDRKAYLQALASLALATPHERLAGSLRTFIPTRSLLVRRVEMLRTNESRLASNRTRPKWRWATLPLIGALALLAAGLRPSAPASAVAAESPASAGLSVPVVAPAATAGQYDFAYLPKEFLFFVAMRPSEIAASPRLAPLAELFNDVVRPSIPAESMGQMTFAMAVEKNVAFGDSALPAAGEYTVWRTLEPVDFKESIAAGYGDVRVRIVDGHPLYFQPGDDELASPERGGLMAYYAPDETTLVGAPRWLLRDLVKNPSDGGLPADAATWNREAKGPVFIKVDLPAVKAMNIGLMGGAPLQMFQPVIDLADDIFITIEDQDPLLLHMRVACKSAEDAVAVEKTVNAVLVLIENVVNTQLKLLEQQLPVTAKYHSGRDLVELLVLGRKILDTAKVNVDGASVSVTASVDDPRRTISESLIPQLRRARQAAQRAQAQNNLKQLALAALNYNDTFNDGYPPAVVYGKSAFPGLNASGDKKAHVPRSWRVELLPLLGQEELYKQYRLDQPWDSEANLKVLQQMPAVYRSPFDAPNSTNASYFAVTGPGTVFDGEEGTPLTAIADGTSNTILWVEAKREIPWTKPEDIAYAPDEAAPTFGGWTKEGEFNVAHCDGSVRILKDVSEPALRQFIEKADSGVAK